MAKIGVYLEVDEKNHCLNDVSFELLSKAKKMKNDAKKINLKDNEFDIIAIALSNDICQDSVKKAFSAGADYFVHIKDESLNVFNQIVFSLSFVEYFSSNPLDIIIFPATFQGRIVAPRITTLLETGLVADCIELDLIEKDEKIMLAATRPTFGSELMATILSKKNPQCATVRPHTFIAQFDEVADNFSDRFFEYNLKYPLQPTGLKILRSFFENVQDEYFENAKIVLAGGMGLYTGKNREYYEKLESLASKIGAKIGATRKVVDMNLMPKINQIGQTGSSVDADLYVAFGISGALQHVAGMKNSKKIIAVNVDENAEIFNYSDYKVVADAKKVIDDLIDYLNK